MNNKNISVGLTYGLVTGLIYIILLFFRWMNAENLMMFGVLAFLNYLLILGIMFFEAHYRRKVEGGFIDLKNLFQTLFISVLIFELLYAIYNFIHVKFIDPEVLNRMKTAAQEMFEKLKMPDDQVKKSMKSFDELDKATQPLQVIKSFFTSLAISGVFAFIISLIMRKNEPVFKENNQ